MNSAANGPLELEQWREFPPRLPGQPIFYPLTSPMQHILRGIGM
jgi:hypothetical protein